MSTPAAVRRDVVYATLPGHRPLALDLHLPESGEPEAVCVYLHGGGWRLGSRRDGPGPPSATSGERFAWMTAQGMAVASVDYRLSGEATFPAQREDVAAACRFLEENRPGLALGEAPLVVWGVSAGGNLAALRALDRGCSPRIERAVCWYAPTDLAALPGDADEAGGHGDRGPDSREARLLGAPAGAAPQLAAQASPVTLAHADAPPFLLLHGAADTDVPLRQSIRLADALTAVGATAGVEPVEGQGHMFRTLGDDALRGLVERCTRFLLGRGCG